MRLQINISDEMCAEVDKYAKLMGVSRSALCNMFIAQGVMAYNKSFDMWETLGTQALDVVMKDLVQKKRNNGKGDSKVGKR